MALDEPAARRRMLVIINPVATKMSDRLKSLVVYALQGRYDVTTVETEAKGHGVELARQAAADGYDVVLAFGGDGTVNEAANGLVGTSTALTCLPGGNNNVVAKLLGIPTDVVDATEHLLGLADAWAPRAVDLGTVNGRHFTFAAGMGLDASVVERVDRNPALKKRFGPFYYVQCAITTFLRKYVVNPPRLEVEVDGRTVGGVSLFVQNAENYTYFNHRAVPLVEGARFDSGTPRRRRAHPRAALRRPDGHVPRAVGRGPDRQAQGRRRVQRLRARRSCAPPTGARSRSRSTATTSTT